eukprot:m.184572 g.184572  ORF g.184572 m.184572 type:complete len:79 (-) comp18488_c0_seq44:319-555(-)
MTCSFKRQGTNTKKDTNQGMLSQHGLGGTQRHCGSDCLEHASVTLQVARHIVNAENNRYPIENLPNKGVCDRVVYGQM